MPPSSTRRVRRNREYDPFADLYNRFWGVEYRAAAWPVLEQLLLSRLQRGASVLDVCCGTGQFARELLDRGYDVAGVDASAPMIRHARRNAPGAAFTVADVRDFDLRRKFHGAWSVFESLNHVPDAEGLEMAFVSIRKHLRRGAPFLFDLVGPATYLRNWNTTHSIIEDDLVCAVRMSYDQATELATCEITLFDDPPAWRRRDFRLHQKCHATAAVIQALGAAGFRNLTLHSRRDLNLPGSLGLDRTFFLVDAG
ncbi:MAG TPA: class I SAM-dependent methyltransferase [Bryobacteraceae bacterium]|nr:class I SAM-dependent methyltransferase [Bryobacteraceae bacterium]